MSVVEQLSWLWLSLGWVGAFAVIIGVWGEEHFDHKVLPYHKQEKLKWRFWIILLCGLAVEFASLIGTTFTSIALEQRVEVLRKANDELEAKTKPRIITEKQINDFIFLTENFPKFPIRVGVEQLNEDEETLSYAWQIRKMLTKAKFPVPDSDTNSFLGIAFMQNAVSALELKEEVATNPPVDIQFISDSTNDLMVFQYRSVEKTNGFRRYDMSGEGTNYVYGALVNYFIQIGMAISWDCVPQWTGTNHCAIYITQKLR
jgi:hypothetical protein